jgi:hypothetical protein
MVVVRCGYHDREFRGVYTEVLQASRGSEDRERLRCRERVVHCMVMRDWIRSMGLRNRVRFEGSNSR